MRQPWLLFLFLLLLSLGGLLLFAWPGVGVTHDSILYLDAARNLKQGLGLVTTAEGKPVPFTHYAPLYPVLVAACSPGPVTVMQGARVLAVLLLVAQLLLVYRLLLACTRHSGYALLGVALTVISGALFHQRMMAWSEPLFLLTSLAGLYGLARGLNQTRPGWVLAAAGCFALAMLTRFAGMVYLPLLSWCVLLYFRKPLGQRLVLLLAGSLLMALPTAAWLYRNYLVTENAVNRQVIRQLISAEQMLEAVKTAGKWLLPTTAPAWLLLLAAAALAGLGWYVSAKTARKAVMPQLASVQLRVLGWFCLFYLLFLFTARSFLDPNIPFDDRILSPLNQALLLSAVLLAWRWQVQGGYSKAARITAILLLLVFSASNLHGIFHHSGERIRYGRAFTDSRLRESALVRQAQALPAGAVLYATGFEYLYLYFLLQRPVMRLENKDQLTQLAPGQPVYLLYLEPCCTEGQLSAADLGLPQAQPLLDLQLYRLSE